MGDEYYLQHPRKQKFYHYLALLMSYSNLGDRRLLGYDKPPQLSFVNSKIILYFGPLVIVSQLMYLYTNYDDLTFDTLGMFYTIFPATCLINVNIVISSNLKSYRRLIRKLFTEIHLYVLYEENKDGFVKKTLIKTERYTRWTTYYLIFFFLVNWLDWIGIPAVNNYNNRELVFNHSVRLQTCVYLWSPLDYSYNYQNWFIIHIINFYIVLCGVTVIATFQSLNNIFVYIIIGHIQIMKNQLRTSFTEDLSDEEVHKRLVKIIKYHAFITRVFNEMEYAFGFNVIGNYTQNLLGNSIVLYQLMYGGRENMVLYITMMMAYTGGPILMSFVLEEVKKQTDDLPEVVYNIPWENMSVSNQKIVLLMLQHVQIVFEFEALGIMIAGVKPMFSILKTTFSYYVMLEKTIGKTT